MNKHIIFVILSAIIWSSMGIIARLTSLPVLSLLFLAFLTSATIFAIILAKKGELALAFRKRYLYLHAIIGLSVVVNNVAFFYAFDFMPIATVTFLHYLAPIIVALFAPLILMENTNRNIWLSIGIALIGLFLFLKPETSLSPYQPWTVILLPILSAFGFAFGIIYSRKASETYSPEEILFLPTLFTALVLLPFALLAGFDMTLKNVIIFLILGAVHQGIAVILYLKALKNLKAQKVSILLYAEPVGAVLLGFIFFNETPTMLSLIGGVLILVACYLVVKDKGTL